MLDRSVPSQHHRYSAEGNAIELERAAAAAPSIVPLRIAELRVSTPSSAKVLVRLLLTSALPHFQSPY